jgi:hypothetical protein
MRNEREEWEESQSLSELHLTFPMVSPKGKPVLMQDTDDFLSPKPSKCFPPESGRNLGCLPQCLMCALESQNRLSLLGVSD